MQQVQYGQQGQGQPMYAQGGHQQQIYNPQGQTQIYAQGQPQGQPMYAQQPPQGQPQNQVYVQQSQGQQQQPQQQQPTGQQMEPEEKQTCCGKEEVCGKSGEWWNKKLGCFLLAGFCGAFILVALIFAVFIPSVCASQNTAVVKKLDVNDDSSMIHTLQLDGSIITNFVLTTNPVGGSRVSCTVTQYANRDDLHAAYSGQACTIKNGTLIATHAFKPVGEYTCAHAKFEIALPSFSGFNASQLRIIVKEATVDLQKLSFSDPIVGINTTRTKTIPAGSVALPTVIMSDGMTAKDRCEIATQVSQKSATYLSGLVVKGTLKASGDLKTSVSEPTSCPRV